MSFRIDGSLYPDEPPPTDLRTLPDAGTLREIRRRAWRTAVDKCRLPALPYLGSIPASMLGDPNLGFI